VPEFATEFEGKVKLVYIDPPFNTGEAFEHYDDGLEHSVWLTMLRDRLLQVKRLLRPDGSVWVHLDDAEQHRGRCVLDEVFGPSAFVATVIWQKRTTRDNRAAFSSAHDYIHIYSPQSSRWKEGRNRLVDGGAYSNPDNDPKGPWRSIPMSAQAGHATAAQFYELVTPTGIKHNPPPGRAWTYTKGRFEELVKSGKVYWPKKGDGKPRLKQYPEDSEGLVPFTLWLAAEVGENSDANSETKNLSANGVPFATPKPESLLARIIHIGSNPGDIVLDCFAGSGTTAAVAHKMGRRWVTAEWSAENIRDFTLPRLEKVISGSDPGGATDDQGWEGGGGMRLFDIAPSVYEVEGATVLLADNVTAGELAESVAAQLGFAYEPDGAFCGRKNAMRLAVIDGVLSEDIVRLLVDALSAKERVTVVATAAEPGAEDLLRSLRSGSRVRKVPRDLARLSRRRSEVVQLVLDGLEVTG